MATDNPGDFERTQPIPPEEEPFYCQVCGDPVSGSDQFCAGCGAEVKPGEPHEHEMGA